MALGERVERGRRSTRPSAPASRRATTPDQCPQSRSASHWRTRAAVDDGEQAVRRRRAPGEAAAVADRLLGEDVGAGQRVLVPRSRENGPTSGSKPVVAPSSETATWTTTRGRVMRRPAASAGRGRPPASRSADSTRPGRSSSSSVGRRRARSTRLSASIPPRGDDRVAEALAHLVLAQLQVQAEQPLDELEPRALPAAAVERLAQLGDVGRTGAPAASITCSAWPSISAIAACRRS